MFDNLYAKTKTSQPIGVKELNQAAIDKKYADRKRIGKTQKDKERKHGKD